MVETELERNVRRGTAGGKPPIIRITNAARDERVFLRNGSGTVVRGFGRTAASEVEQESALVTADSELFSNQTTGFTHERMLKGTGVGLERGRLEA